MTCSKPIRLIWTNESRSTIRSHKSILNTISICVHLLPVNLVVTHHIGGPEANLTEVFSTLKVIISRVVCFSTLTCKTMERAAPQLINAVL